MDFLEILKAVFLGIVEGITEWLPISSTCLLYTSTCSAGLAIAPENSKDFDAVFVRADQALYQAKQQGKNRLGVL